MPLTADVQVVNLTLARIGEDEITDLDQAGKVARTMRNAFEPARDSLLCAFRWNFAIARTDLASSGSAAFGFTYKFQLPDDCLAVIGIFDEDEDMRNYTSTKQAWKVEGRELLYDSDPVYIYYTRAITSPRMFAPLFTSALAWWLAIDTAYALSTGPDQVTNAWKGFKEVVRMARLANAIEGTPEVITSSEWLDARFQDFFPGFRAGPIV